MVVVRSRGGCCCCCCSGCEDTGGVGSASLGGAVVVSTCRCWDGAGEGDTASCCRDTVSSSASASGIRGEGLVGPGDREEGDLVGLLPAAVGLRLSEENMRMRFLTRPGLSGVLVGVASAIMGVDILVCLWYCRTAS